jgi:hypothetical protein
MPLSAVALLTRPLFPRKANVANLIESFAPGPRAEEDSLRNSCVPTLSTRVVVPYQGCGGWGSLFLW